MRAVDQTTFGFPGGNCFSACVASLLEIPLEEVPYFMGEDLGDDGGAWFRRFEEWLAPRNLYPICMKIGDGWRPTGFHILSGQSPRKPEDKHALHSVVARGSEIEHDPHPSRAGLLSRDDVVLLIPIDPGRDELPIFKAPPDTPELRAKIAELQRNAGPLTLEASDQPLRDEIDRLRRALVRACDLAMRIEGSSDRDTYRRYIAELRALGEAPRGTPQSVEERP